MSETKNILETVRDVAQDVLVPRLKALEVSVEALRTEMKFRHEALEKTILEGNERTAQLVRHCGEMNTQATQNLSRKIDDTMEIRERLAALEARQPRQ